MRINDKYFISQDRTTKAIKTNLLSTDRRTEVYSSSDTNYYGLSKILYTCRKRKLDITIKNKQISRWLKSIVPTFDDTAIEARIFNIAKTAGDTTPETPDAYESLANEISDKLLKFFSEFNFTPSFRYINTLALVKDKVKFTVNYFNLQNHPFAKEIAEKTKSAEFKQICDSIAYLNSHVTGLAPINSRFELYFGEPGTGKTTKAMEYGDLCIVCASDMLPVDLMQNFAFSDGKAEFQKSSLWVAMEEGKTIILDEINMLPFESLRFLQGILDNKECIDFKGFRININENFKIIGTMNLNVGGQCISLPAPLVDRCSDIVEYEMTAKLLAGALLPTRTPVAC